MLAFGNVFHTAREQPSGIIKADIDTGWTWLRSMQGCRILYCDHNMQDFLDKSIFHALISDTGSWKDRTANPEDSDGTISQASAQAKALYELCWLDWNTVAYESPYQQPLEFLHWALLDNHGREDICLFMKFIGNLSPMFFKLLEDNDPKAMLILSYWCAISIQLDQWWIVRSATVECRRLCACLEDDSDPRIRDLLVFPASNCGYKLREREESLGSRSYEL